MELRNSAQIKAKAEKANEITILATPCLVLGHDEQLNDYEPTNNYEQTNKDEQLNKKPKKQPKAKPEGFTKAKAKKTSRTEAVSVPPKTPEKSINMSFSNMSSPASIILGIDDHPNVSPIKTDLLGLFSAPTQVISPLKSTYKKRKLNNAERETFIVIEDPTLNAQVNSGSRSEPCPKKDSSHLVLTNVTTVQREKNTTSFLLFQTRFKLQMMRDS